MTSSLIEDVKEFFELLPKEESNEEYEEEKEKDQVLQQFSTQFISKYYDTRDNDMFINTMSALIDEDFVSSFLDSRRYIESETFLKLSIILCSLHKNIVKNLRNEGSIVEILMAMDSNVENPSIIQLGSYALILSSAYPVESEYLEESMISHISDIMRIYSNNEKTFNGLCIALSNLSYGRNDVKMFALKYKVHEIVISACKNLQSENLYLSALILFRNLTTYSELSSHDYTSLFFEFICSTLETYRTNNQLILNGLWTLLNLLKSSLHNKVTFVHNYSGLNIIKTLLEIYRTDEQIVEICFILLHQLAKAAKNRVEIRKSSIFDLILDILKNFKDSVVVVKPFILFVYRFSFNKENRQLIGKKAIKQILRPLKKNMPSEQVHLYIAKLILKLSEEPKNKELIKNEDGIGSLVSSLNFFPDKPIITNYTTKAMNEIFKSAKNIPTSSDSDSDSDEIDSDEAYDVQDAVLNDPSIIEADIPSQNETDDQSTSTSDIMDELDQIMNDLDPNDISKIKDLESEIAHLKKVIQQVKNEMEEEKQRYENIIEEKDNEIADLQQTSLSLAEKLEDVTSKSESEIKELKGQIESLKAQVSEYEAFKVELQEMKNERTSREKSHQESIESLKVQLNQLIQDQETYQTQLESQEKISNDYKSQIENLKLSLEAKDLELRTLYGRESEQSKLQAESLLRDIENLEDAPENFHSHMIKLYKEIQNRESDQFEIFARYLSNSILNLKLFSELEKMRKYH